MSGSLEPLTEQRTNKIRPTQEAKGAEHSKSIHWPTTKFVGQISNDR